MTTQQEDAQDSPSRSTATPGSPVSAADAADYVAWRVHFFRDRLRLASWIAFVSSLTATALALQYFLLEPSQALWLLRDGAVLLCLLTGLALHRTAWGRQHPGWLFLGLCWSMTLFSQIGASLSGSGQPPILLWTLVFLALAAVIPVRWPLHVAAQLGVLAYYFGLNAALGLATDLTRTELLWQSLYLFWVCFICDLSVYLYERLQRAEFESRRDLRVFVQAVSYDLRGPVLSSLLALRPLLLQPDAQLTIARPTLEQMLESSQRQLDLIQSLLECAGTTLRSSNAAQMQQLVGQLGLANWIKALQTVWGEFRRALGWVFPVNPATQTQAAASEYELWRQRFLLSRLRLVWWIALSGALTLSIPDLWEALSVPREVPELFIYAGVVGCLLAWFVLFRTQAGRARTRTLFLSFAWLVALVPQIGLALTRDAEPDISVWTLVFLMLATLIPVHWPLHIVAQLSAFACYLAVNAALGLRPEISWVQGLWLGWYVFWVCFICDLSVYLYERLQRVEFESRRQLRVFLHAVSHDLRTPVLGSLMVLQRLLAQSGDPVSMSRTIPGRMVQSGERQLRLINSLLDAHASHGQGLDLRCESLPLHTLIQDAIADLEPLLEKNQASLTNLLPTSLPRVYADPAQVWRVLENLITNALKHNPPGVSLSLKTLVESGRVRCEVRDDGVGIAPEQCQRLFDLYTRGAQARHLPGLGLGLYLCRQIIHAHGGEIGVESCPPGGSTFWFTLPLAAASVPGPQDADAMS